MSFGENLKKMREKKGLTQEELAESMGVNKATICKYEKGVREPTLSATAVLAKELGCTVDSLMA